MTLKMRWIWCGLVVMAGQAFASPSAKEDLVYANGLNRMRMPGYAQVVLDRIKETGSPDYLRVQVAALVMTEKGIIKARKLISKRDQNSLDTWKMKLALADGYYAWGRYPEMRSIYDSFLKKYSGKQNGAGDIYRDAAYKYAQILEILGDAESAVLAYDAVLSSKLEKHAERQIMVEQASIMVRLADRENDKAKKDELCSKVDESCDKLLWTQDTWFPVALVMKAYVRLLRGDSESAMKLLTDYESVLKQIDV